MTTATIRSSTVYSRVSPTAASGNRVPAVERSPCVTRRETRSCFATPFSARAPASESARHSTSSDCAGDCTSRCAISAPRSPSSLAGNRTCDEIVALVENHDSEALLAGQLYNALFAASDKLAPPARAPEAVRDRLLERRRHARRRQDLEPRGRRPALGARRGGPSTRPAGVWHERIASFSRS